MPSSRSLPGHPGMAAGRPVTTQGGQGQVPRVPRTRNRLTYGRPETYHMDRVPDVDHAGNPIPVAAGPVYEALDSLATSVWTADEPSLRASNWCPGCGEFLWWYLREAFAGRTFWWEVSREADENEGVSYRLFQSGALIPERNLLREDVPCIHHTCEFGTRMAPEFHSFGISTVSMYRAGFNGHALRFQLRLGLVLPQLVPRRRYRTVVPISAKVPLHGLPLYYWGSHLIIQGKSIVSWCLEGNDTPPGPVYEATGDSVVIRHMGGKPGSLWMLPPDILVVAAHGPRKDAFLSYVQCSWTETHHPVPEGAKKLELFIPPN